MFSLIAGSIAFIAYAIGATLIAARGRGTWPNRLLALSSTLTAVWAAAWAYQGAFGDISLQVYGAIGVARDASWFAVLIAFLRQDSAQARLWRTLAAVAGAVILLHLCFSISGFTVQTNIGVKLNATLTSFVTAMFGLVLIENLLRNLPRQRVWSLKLLAIGLGSLYAYTIALRIPELLGATSLPEFAKAEPLAYLIVLPLLIVTAVRNEALRLQLHSSRNIAFHTTAVLLAGVLLQGTAAAAYFVRNYGGTPGQVLAIVIGFTSLIALIVAISTASIRSQLRAFINENFYSYKYDYRIEWKRFIATLSEDQTSTGPERVLRTLTNLLDSPGGILWVRREGWHQFLPLAHWSLPERFGPIDANDPLLLPFAQKDLDYLELGPGSEDQLISTWHARFPNAWLAVPMRFKDRLIAFALVQRPRATRPLDWEDRNLLGLTTLELGAHLAHEHMAQALSDSQQMSEFNKRVTFAVHDLKNTAGQLSLLAKNAARFGDQAEFRTDMVSTIVHASANLQRLIAKLTSTETVIPPPEAVRLVDLSELVVRVATRPSKIKVICNARDNENPFHAVISDPPAFESALQHVLSNAIEASPEGSAVSICIIRASRGLEIKVTDKGPGMTQEFISDQLFRPLVTTKKAGLGVGAYQARTLLRELGGDLFVESEIGVGTTATLVLPASSAFQKAINL